MMVARGGRGVSMQGKVDASILGLPAKASVGGVPAADGGAAPLCPECGALAIVAMSNPAESERKVTGSDESTVWSPGQWSTFGASGGPYPELADFEFHGEVGRGGMGIVYKARWRSGERVVAVKVIRKDRLMHEDAVQRFRRECRQPGGWTIRMSSVSSIRTTRETRITWSWNTWLGPRWSSSSRSKGRWRLNKRAST